MKARKPSQSPAPPPRVDRRALIVVALVLAVVVFVRLRVAGVPLERDEGEYAYAGQLILQGVPPYQLAYNMKFPGTYYVYALILALLGQTDWAIRVGLLLLNVATAFVVYQLGRRLIDSFGAAVAASTFLLLSIDRWVMGGYAHATHFVLLPVLAGLLVLLYALDSGRMRTFFAAGALLGTGVLMKQQAVLFAPLMLGYALWHTGWRADGAARHAIRRLGIISAGVATPFAILCGVLAAQGVLGPFWFWTFQYAREYVSETPLAEAGAALRLGWVYITQETMPVWMVAGAGAVALWIIRRPAAPRIFISGLVVASFAAVCPGFYFRPHYFILMLPAVALLVGVALSSAELVIRRLFSARAAQATAWTAWLAIMAGYGFAERRYLFTMPDDELTLSVYQANPFLAAPQIATYLRDHTTPNDRIAVLGSEPEIFFYAGRRSASGYIYTYSLMEPQPYAGRMQDEMIKEIETAAPAYLLDVQVGASWAARPSSDQRILTWIRSYVDRCYTRVGVAEMFSTREPVLRWDAFASGYQPVSDNIIYTYRRLPAVRCSSPR